MNIRRNKKSFRGEADLLTRSMLEHVEVYIPRFSHAGHPASAIRLR